MHDTLVLCYHALSAHWHADLSVTPQMFTAQLDLLQRRGYEGVTFSEASRPAPGRRVAVTFDDAFASVDRRAKPVLDALDWPGTIFTVSSFAATGKPLSWPGIDRWERTEFAAELAGLEWHELRALADAGWEIGSHTSTHPWLTQIGDDALDEELQRSKAEVEAGLGRPCPTIAYPYGDFDERVVEATRRAGYETAATLSVHPPHPLEHPRVGIYHPDTMWRFRVKVSRGARRARSATAGG